MPDLAVASPAWPLATPHASSRPNHLLERQQAATDYRSKARDASALASATPLLKVRDRQEAAAAAWLDLAALEDQRIAHAMEVAAKVAAREAKTLGDLNRRAAAEAHIRD